MFNCRLPLNTDIQKLKKFFDSTQKVDIAIGKAGIKFISHQQDKCLYTYSIHSNDLYQIRMGDTKGTIWENGGIVRTLDLAPVTSIFAIKPLDNKGWIDITVNNDATIMSIKLICSDGTVSPSNSKDIVLSEPVDFQAPPANLTYANATVAVHTFKTLCGKLSKAKFVIIESRSNQIKIISDQGEDIIGNKQDTSPVLAKYYVDTFAFQKASKINIGNTKHGNAGFYLYPDKPFKLKVKLGNVTFEIYSITFDGYKT